MRKIHLWIGLVTSLLLFLEAGTGLILMEPWLIGFEREEHDHRGEFHGTLSEKDEEIASSLSEFEDRFRGDDDFSAFRMIRGLHEGRIGDVDASLLIDLSAISILILTATGIYLSVKILVAERKRNNRRKGDGTNGANT